MQYFEFEKEESFNFISNRRGSCGFHATNTNPLLCFTKHTTFFLQKLNSYLSLDVGIFQAH